MKSVLLISVIIILLLYIVVNIKENFQNPEVVRLRNRIIGMNSRLSRVEGLANDVFIMRDGLTHFNLRIMNESLERVENKLRNEMKMHNTNFNSKLKNIKELLNNFKNEDVQEISSQLDLLVEALDNIKHKELNDFKNIKNQLINLSTVKKTKINFNNYAIIIGSVVVMAILIKKK
jgi:hypothetical protein